MTEVKMSITVDSGSGRATPNISLKSKSKIQVKFCGGILMKLRSPDTAARGRLGKSAPERVVVFRVIYSRNPQISPLSN